MGATSRITFTKAGVYRLTTKPGEDCIAGIETVGADNVPPPDGTGHPERRSIHADEGRAPLVVRRVEY